MALDFDQGNTDVPWKVLSAKYVNENEMTVYVPKAAIAAPGTDAVVVKNPTPGGGKSNALTVTIK